MKVGQKNHEKINYKFSFFFFFFYRESHFHLLEDCFPIHTTTWLHLLQLLQLSPLVLQHFPETTVSPALGLGCVSVLIWSPPLSPQAKTCLQTNRLEVQTHNLSRLNQEAESQVQLLTITVTKPKPSRRFFHRKTFLRVPLTNYRTYKIWWEDLINHFLHIRPSHVLFSILHMRDIDWWTHW